MKLYFVSFTLLFLCISLNLTGQVQLNEYLTGENPDDGFGSRISLANNGLRMAVAAPSNYEAYYKSGHVRVYDYINENWVQIGADIDGESGNDRDGMQISLSGNGEFLAIGSPQNSTLNHQQGKVRVFKLVSGNWIQQGQSLQGSHGLANFGNSVALSDDGNRLVVGEYGNSTNESYSGKTSVFQYDGNMWQQLGQNLFGTDRSDKFGYHVAITGNGNHIIVAAPRSGSYLGKTKVYTYSGAEWTQSGGIIYTDVSKVAISTDGLKIAIADYKADSNGRDSGRVKLFELNGLTWVQKGQDINGDGAHYQAGASVSLAGSGDRIAITMANRLQGINGIIRTYDFNNNLGTWESYGLDVVNTSGTITGMSTSDSGHRIVHGSQPDAYSAYGEQFVNTYDISLDQSQGFNFIEGFIRLDSDSNNCQTFSNPLGKAKVQVVINNDTISDYTDPDGFFKLLVPAGSYLVEVSSVLPVGLNTPDKIPVSFNSTDETQSVDFCIASKIVLEDKLDLAFRSNYNGYQSLILSSDGNRMAVGYPDFSTSTNTYENTYGQGKVVIYEKTNDTWAPIGQQLVGGSGQDAKGWALSFSENGDRLAISSPFYDKSPGIPDHGRITIYEFNGSNWVQIGQDIIGEIYRGRFGSSLELSHDGNRVIIGNSDYGKNVSAWGRSTIYEFDGNAWNILGSRIQGNSYSFSGKATSISGDGSIIAIGAPDYSYSNLGGEVRIFQFDNITDDWVQLGQSLYGENAQDNFGESVQLTPDGQTIAIGSKSQNEKGYAKVYVFDGSNWNLKGGAMLGELVGDTFGHAITVTDDGNMVAIGGPEHDSGNTNQVPGYVRVFQYANAEWFQMAPDINAPENISNFGLAVSLSALGNKLAVKSFDDVFVFDLIIQDTEPLTLEVSKINVSCYGSTDGSIEVSATAGSQPYIYELYNTNNNSLITSGTSNIFANLSSGSYYVLVTDSNSNQIQSNSIAIHEPDALTSTVTVNSMTCSGANDGTATITASGGTLAYEYSLNGGPFTTTNVFENLPIGNYFTTIRDAAGCQVSMDFTIDSPAPINAEVITTSVSCEDGNDGSISIIATDGAAPLQYSINTVEFFSEPNFTNLTAGVYDVIIQDANGCFVSVSAIINEKTDCSDFTLPASNFIIETTAESCASSNNGNILLRAEENLDYTATLVGGTVNQAREFRTFTNFADLEAGAYELCITVAGEPDYQKCFSIQISEPDGLEVDSRVDDSGKTVSLSLKGSTTYFINVNGTEYSTSEDQITLPLSKVENNITVKTDKECQGVYEKMLLATYDSISLFPNPVEQGDVSILLPSNNVDKEVLLTLFSQNGIRVLEKIEEPEGRTVKINMDVLPPGIYTIIITTESQNSMRKIIKK